MAMTQTTPDRGPTILVVEDEPLVRDTIVLELEDAGYAVVEAADGATALALLEGGCDVDLLFTDIRMPGSIDGWQLAERARDLRPGIPVVYTTGFTDDSPRLVDGSRLFKKPYKAEAVIASIRDLVLPPPP